VENCTLRSPIDGVVLRIANRPGEFVAPGAGDHILALADTRQLIVRAEIEERDVGRVKVGARAALRFIGEEYEMTGLVGRQTARSTDPANRFDQDTLEVMIRLETEDSPLPGLVGQAFDGFAVGRQILVEIGT